MVKPGCLTKTENSLMEGRKYLAKQEKEVVTQKAKLLLSYISLIREKVKGNKDKFDGAEKIKNVFINSEDSLPNLRTGEYPGLGMAKEKIEAPHEISGTMEVLSYISYVSISLSGFLTLSGMLYLIVKIIWKNCVIT